MQHEPAHHLDVIVSQADGPFGGFTHGRKGFRQDLFERVLLSLAQLFFVFALIESLILLRLSKGLMSGKLCPELVGLGAQCLVAELFIFRLECVDLFDLFA